MRTNVHDEPDNEDESQETKNTSDGSTDDRTEMGAGTRATTTTARPIVTCLNTRRISGYVWADDGCDESIVDCNLALRISGSCLGCKSGRC